MARRLRDVESRNVTFIGPGFPVFWSEARGANVRDVDGNVYVDLTGAFAVSFLGHAPDSVVEAIKAQSDVLVHGMGDVHPPALKVELLERLAGLAPWDETRAVLSSSGSEAVETALKTALVATGRPGVVAFDGAYHGLTLGSLAATSRPHFRAPFEPRLYAGVEFVDFPVDADSAARVIDRVEELLREGTRSGDAVGAVVIEPIQGRTGVRIPPPEFLEELVARARDAGVVSIFDEIFTGLGRTGSLFCGPAMNAVPDLVCIGKSLGGGLPLSACLGRAEVMDAWPESGGEAIHTSTFLGHPLSCAAALAFLDSLETSGAMERARALGERIITELERAFTGRDDIVEVRGRGLLIGIELKGPAGVAAAATRVALCSGVILLPAGADGRVVELTPPVTLTDAQLTTSLEIVIRSVGAALDGGELEDA